MTDGILLGVFYLFAALAVGSALLVVTQNNPVRCVLFLVLTFFASAVLWILVEAEFLALILVLVYVGAVMTLFLFVVMMLNIDIESMKKQFFRYIPVGLFVVALLTTLLMQVIPKGIFSNSVETKSTVLQMSNQSTFAETSLQSQSTMTMSNTEALGMVLYTNYVLAFELAAIILLVSIVAAITLVHRGATRSKTQNITKQIMTRKEDRVHLVTIKPEKEH